MDMNEWLQRKHTKTVQRMNLGKKSEKKIKQKKVYDNRGVDRKNEKSSAMGKRWRISITNGTSVNK